MEKIPTVFERDWLGNRGVVDKYVVNPARFVGAVATVKLDGANVRLFK